MSNKNNIELPAIRGEMGDWAYYMTTFSFENLCKLTESPEDVLYPEYGGEEGLSEMSKIPLDEDTDRIDKKMQRAEYKNHTADIVYYLQNEKQRFFNSLVLAVFDQYPTWRELLFEFNGQTYDNDVGIISFSSSSKLMPIDGQHRLQAIKAAIRQNPKMKNERVSVIIIGHKNDSAGIQRSRRLFTTLNKTAKPVGGKDLIILDEDNAACIITRKFYTENTINILGKRAIALYDGESIKNENYFSTIITINYIHERLLDLFLDINSDIKKEFMKARDIKKISVSDFRKRFKRSRPTIEILEKYESFLVSFWEHLILSIHDLTILENEYKQDDRNTSLRQSGEDNAIFRPIFLKNLILAIISITKKEKVNITDVIDRISKIDLKLTAQPWVGLIWDTGAKTMRTDSVQTALRQSIEFLLSIDSNMDLESPVVENYFKRNSIYSELGEDGKIAIVKMFNDLKLKYQ